MEDKTNSTYCGSVQNRNAFVVDLPARSLIAINLCKKEEAHLVMQFQSESPHSGVGRRRLYMESKSMLTKRPPWKLPLVDHDFETLCNLNAIKTTSFLQIWGNQDGILNLRYVIIAIEWNWKKYYHLCYRILLRSIPYIRSLFLWFPL